MRNRVSAFKVRLLGQAAVVAVLAGTAAGCSSAGGGFKEPFITGSTANQRQIIGQNDDQAMPGPVADNDAVSRSDLAPPPGAVASAATYSPASADASRPMPLSGGAYTWSAAGGTVVQVARGDTLEALSAKYGVPGGEIARANDIRGPSELNPGKIIVIPVRVAASTAAPGPAAPIRQVAARVPASGTIHVVEPGETLYSIARQNGTTADAIMAMNGLSSSSGIRVGQRLQMPDGVTPPSTVKVAYEPDKLPASVGAPPKPLGTIVVHAPKPGAPEAPVAVVPPAPKINVASLPPKAPVIAPAPAPAMPAAPAAAAAPTATVAPAPAPVVAAIDPTVDQASANGTTFRWPVRGRIIASFGAKSNGEKNDGINLAVPEGTSVKAAEAGTVIYAGNELPGYGNLVLIRHADGWVSAYAHNAELEVKRGDQVKRGQTIGLAGMTGSVTSPQVHFELRRGAKPVNPLDYLAGA